MALARNLKRRLVLAAAVASVVGSGRGWSLGATDNWTGATNNSWDTNTNWSLGQPPTFNDDAVFGIPVPATGRTVLLGTGEFANSLTFNGAYTLQGGTLDLTSGNVTVNLAQAIGPNTVNPAPSAGAEVATSIVDFGLTKLGSGALFLAGNNTFTGTTIINAGTVAGTNDTNFGAVTTIGGSTSFVNDIQINNGATLQLIGASGNQGALFTQINRFITVGSGGATLDVPSAGGNNSGSAGFESANSLVNGGASSNTLTKTGQGQFFLLNTNNYNGGLTLATSNGSIFDIRAQGALTGASNITLSPGTVLNVDNNAGLANGVAGSPLASTNNQDRVANNIPITLNGGALQYTGRNVAGQIREVFGAAATPVTLNQGQSTFLATSAGTTGNGGEMEIGNLARTPVGSPPTVNGGGTANFTGSGTLGTAGNNGRIFIDSINGGAGPADQTLVGGWATAGNEFAGYTAANGVISAGNAGFTGNTAAMPGSSNAAANVRLTGVAAVPSGGVTINSLSIQNATAGSAGTPDITFAAATDTLTLNSGGFITSNANRFIGTTALPGQITSGGQELFFHINGSTTTVNSVITDNAGGAVTLVKDQGGNLTLNNLANTYTGGTYVQGGGSLSTGGTANIAYLGTGPVFINNATLNQGARGATTSTAGYTLVNNGEIVLTNGSATGAGVYQAAGDRYTLAAGTTVYANSPGAGGGFNSLTRVTSLTAGGQIVLAPDSIVQYNLTGTANQGNGTVPTQGTGTLAIQNLGTAADLYFSPGGGTQSANNIVVVGAGTPYKGVSTDRSNKNYQGTIQANSDFNIQGLVGPGFNAEFNLGNGGNALTVTNTSAGNVPIRAYLLGNVRVNTGTSFTSAGPNLPANLTFIGTPGSQFTLQGTNALGADTANPANNPLTIMQGGSLFNIFPDRSIVNGNVILQAGARFLGDDNAVPGTAINGGNSTGTGTSLGSIGGPGSITFERNAVFDLTQAYALSGNATLNWQPGSVLRLNNTSSPVGIGSKVGPAVVYEFFNGNPSLTNGAGAITTISPTAPATSPENVSVSGGIFTNDSNSRTLSSGNGRILIGGGGATFAATTNTTFTVSEDYDLGTNTLNIGLNDSVDGQPKFGVAPTASIATAVSIGVAGSKALPGSVINILPGYEFQQNVTNAFPDLATINVQSGGFLRMRQNNFNETVGGLSGAGFVVSDQGNAQLQVGLNNANTTFSGLFSVTADPFVIPNNSIPNQNDSLNKVGTGTLTITNGGGANQVNQWNATLTVNGGGVTLSGNGALNFGNDNVNRTGTLTLDNTATALNNRLGGNTKTVNLGGGTFTLNGNASTAVTESLSTINVNLGGNSVVNLNNPGAGLSLATSTLAGRSISTFILRGTNLGAAPGAGVSTFTATTPNLFGTVAPGTTTTALRPDILSDTPSTGGTAPLGFVTQDNATNGFRRLNDTTEYTTSVSVGVSNNNNVQLSSNVLIPQSPSPVSPPTDTQIQSLVLNSGAATITNNGGPNLTNAQTRFRVNSGGVLVQPGVSTTFTGPYFDSGTVFYFHTYGNLTVNGQLLGGGLTKSGPGSLTLGAGATSVLTGNFAVNDGAVTLGANSPFFFNTGGSGVAPGALWMTGGSLDLNGNSILTGNLSSSNTNVKQDQPGVGGNITNSGAAATLTAFGSNFPFNGSISGPISFQKVGNSDTTFTNPNTYTGATTLRGGSITLRSQGTLASTNYTVNYGTLSLDNFNGIVNPTTGLYNIDNRIPASSTVTLRGGVLQLQGAPGEHSGQQVASVTLVENLNFINSFANGSGSADLTLNSFTRNAGDTTVDFRGNNGIGTLGRYAPATTLTNGTPSAIPGMNADSRILINAGLPASATFTGAAGSVGSTSNGFFGPWAVVNETDYAAYLTPVSPTPANLTTGGGVINIGNTGLGAPAYTTATATGGGFASGNVTNIPNIDVTLPAGGALTGALRIGDNATRNLNFTANSDTLNLETGGLLRTNNNNGTNIGTTAVRGQITAGGTGASGTQTLYLHFNSSQANASITSGGIALTNAQNNIINSAIIDNGSAPVRVVKDLGGGVTFTAFNSYTGGTVVNGGTLLLASTANATGAAGGVTIPGDLTINGNPVSGGTVTLASPGQIISTANVSINNGGTLNLPNTGANTSTTFNNLSFTNLGGTGNPNTNNNGGPAATGVTLTNTLNINGNITAVNDNPANTPTINGISTSGTGATLSDSVTIVDFGAGAVNGERAVTINTSGLSPVGMYFNGGIARGSITKTGPNMLVLNAPTGANGAGAALPTSTFTGGLFINQGQVRVDNANSLSTSTNAVTVGTGASDPTIALVINTGTIPANITTTLNGGQLAPYNNSPTLSGPVNINANSTLALNDYYQTTTARSFTLPGVVSGSGALTITASPVSGQNGTLTLTNPANNYSGAVTIGANAIVTANSTSGVGNVFTTGAITMQGGTLNLRDNGSGSGVTLAYNNNLTVTGNATLNLDRSTANTNNTFQFNNLAINNATLTTQNNGNGYQTTFAGTTTVTGEAAINHVGGNPVNLGTITGAGNFSKYGTSQVNVTAAPTAFTGGTTVGQGTLRIAPASSGAGLGSGPLAVRAAGTLQTDPGAGLTVNYAPSSVTNDGLIYARTGTANFGAAFLGSSPSLGLQPFSALSERFAKPSDVGEPNFDSAATADPHISFENANNFLTPSPGPGKVGPGIPATGTTPLSFDLNALSTRSGGYFGTTEQGVAYRGTITIGGTIPAGPVSFGTASDDGSTLYVDLNGDHVFTANERIVSNLGPHGVVQAIGTATLAAGTYDVAVGYYQGGGGGSIEVRFASGNSVPYASQFVVNPGGQINAPGNLQVDAGASLLAGGFNATTATVNGNLTINAPSTASAALTLVSGGGGTINVGGTTAPTNVLTVQTLSITGGTLTKDGVGTLLVNGTGNGTGALNVIAGTLGGSGSIAGPATIASGARLSPGNSPGVLTIGGPLTLSTGSTYVEELGGTTPGNGPGHYDQTNVTGATGTPLTVAGSVLSVADFGGFTSSDAQKAYYVLTQAGTTAVAGTFVDPTTGQPIPEGGVVHFADGSGTGNVTYLANWTGDPNTSSLTGGNDVALYNVNVTPEPAGVGLLALAGAALLARRRRRRA